MKHAFSPGQLAECAEREVTMREKVYPRLVDARKMSQKTADREIAMMRAIRHEYVEGVSSGEFDDEKLADCARREIKSREKIYRRQVAERRMAPETARRELEMMRQIESDYRERCSVQKELF